VLHVAPAPFQLPAPVSREVLLTDGHQLAALGGLDATKTSTAAVTSLDPTSGAVRSFGTLTDPVHDSAGVFLGGRYVVIAGGDGSPAQRSTVQAVPAVGGASQPIGNLAMPRADLVAALVNGTAYALGGGLEATTLYPSVEASSDGVTWRAAGTLAAPVRYPAVAVVGNAVYLFGGVATAQGTDTKDIQRYDPATGTTQIVGQLPATLSHATAVVLGDSVYLLGGFVNDVVSAQVLRVQLPSVTVTPAGSLPTPLSDAAATVVNGVGYLVGGQGSTSAPVTTVLTLSLGH